MKSRVKAKSRGKRKAARSKTKTSGAAQGRQGAAAGEAARTAGRRRPIRSTAGSSPVRARSACKVEKSWMAAVRANLRVTLDQGAMVAEFPLPDDAEPAPVFRA